MERVPSDLGKDNAEETASNTTENEEVKCQRPGGKVQMHPFKMQTEIRRNYFRIIINYQFSTFYLSQLKNSRWRYPSFGDFFVSIEARLLLVNVTRSSDISFGLYHREPE